MNERKKAFSLSVSDVNGHMEMTSR